jgi:hypothetical protein
MLTKKEIATIIGIAMLYDDKHLFDAWTHKDVKEWVDRVADAIIAADENEDANEKELVKE